MIWAISWENLTNAICEQQRHRSACATARSGQHLFFVCCLYSRMPILAKSKISRLASLCSRAGLFESYLVVNSRRQVFSVILNKIFLRFYHRMPCWYIYSLCKASSDYKIYIFFLSFAAEGNDILLYLLVYSQSQHCLVYLLCNNTSATYHDCHFIIRTKCMLWVNEKKKNERNNLSFEGKDWMFDILY